MTAVSFFGPDLEEALARVPDFVFHHIGEIREPVSPLTSASSLVHTTTVDGCPELDCLLVGAGPNPTHFQIPPKYVESIQRHVAAGKLLFTTCTGAAAVAATGVLDGKRATVNNMEYDWTKDKKWIVVGNVGQAGEWSLEWMCSHTGWKRILGSLSLDYEPRDSNGLFNALQ
ncbi:hypothetical protein N7537_010242 [Penicillium hordei]|uniref:DJ-1/PfpI domain-containing protein n=1 Tax=Penicillium hordei TaxID=40994 RepID=A0AAD6GWI2_9EURO|nr:uncharacterized protein N7537_010242 [Penicillium hordei]KAJ5593338.1 hypothetical protein N7537_010242 [Penicillium hordei]